MSSPARNQSPSDPEPTGVVADAAGDRWWPSRYGPEDQIGMLNEITPAKIAGAARLVREGRVYDLGRTLHAGVPRFEV